jgi:flagellin-like protein
MQKGVSPLIASVLLIAVTMAIAGVMATWATQFTATKISESSSGADCIGAIDISSLQFNGSHVSVRLRNLAERINLTGIKGFVEYSTPGTLGQEFDIKNYNITPNPDPLAPGSFVYINYNTGTSTKPQKLQVRAANCLRYPADLFFP